MRAKNASVSLTMAEQLRLGCRRVVELTPKAPFAFDATMHKPDHFPSDDNEWLPGVRWQTMLWNGRRLGLKLEDWGTVDMPRLGVSVWSEEELAESLIDDLVGEINYRHDLLADLGGFSRAFENDAQLGPIIGKWRGMRPISYSSLYEYLMIAVVLQNATVKRSVSMLRALFERYGVLLSFDGKHLFSFWTPETINASSEQGLRALKIGYRANSVKRVTEAFVAGRIDEQQLRCRTKEEQRSALLGLYGIGPASVGYILFDVFHHWDELGHISPWEQRIYSKLFFDADPDTPLPVNRLIDFFDRRFGRYKMLAVNYIWEDLFWRSRHENIGWLEPLIRL